MDEINKSVLNNLRSGQYYIDARDWYSKKYIYPIFERSLIFVIAVIFLIALAWGWYIIDSLYPNITEEAITIRIPNTIDYQPIINDIGKDEVDPEPEQPVAKYLAANYVKMRESYSYNGLEVQVNKIRNSSTKFVYKQFYNNISLDNPDSPVLLYQRTSSRSVDIKSVNFSTDANNIMVRFDATVSDHKNKNVSTTTRWIANVSFSMSDINRVIKENTEFNFIVTDYHVQQIK